MPRPGPRRPLVAFRLSEAEVGGLDELAERYGVTRSDVIRELLTAALEDPPALRQAENELARRALTQAVHCGAVGEGGT